MQFRRLTSKDEVSSFISTLPETIVIDCETTGLSFKKDKLLDVSIADSVDSAVLFPSEFVKELNNLVNTTVVFHNMKFDLRFLRENGLTYETMLSWNIRDTIIYHHLEDENKSHKLDSIVKEQYGDNYKEVFWEKYSSYDEASEEDKLAYACKDTVYTLRLYNALSQKIPYEKVVKLVHCLALELLEIEIRGVLLDKKLLIDTGISNNASFDEMLIKARECAKDSIEFCEVVRWNKEMGKYKTPTRRALVTKPDFNFESSQQVGYLLYDVLGIPEQKSKTKSRTVDEAALANVADYHEIVPIILSMRENRKIQGTYIEGLLEREVSGRIYPEFNPTGPVTGRISSENPNLQNIPREGVIRGFFLPDPGMVLLDFDYGMIEVVIAAHFSQDKNLLNIIHNGESKHDITAKALGIPRQLAKTVNFGMQYQCGPKKLAFILGCDLKKAEEHWNTYWNTYSGEKKVIDQVKHLINTGQNVKTPFGRERHFPKSFDTVWQKEAAYREGYSALIQGTAADICNLAYVRVSRYLRKSGYGLAMWPVHDSILVQVKPEFVDTVKEDVKNIMVDAGKFISLSVPLSVDIKGPLQRWEK